MEYFQVASSTHCLGTDGHTKKDTTKQIVVQNGQTFFSDFHIYECQLRPDRVDFFMDSKWIYGLMKDGCLNNGIFIQTDCGKWLLKMISDAYLNYTSET
jgi:hypothetical protein